MGVSRVGMEVMAVTAKIPACIKISRDMLFATILRPRRAQTLAVDAVLRHGERESTVTVAISPGEREFRVVSVEGRPAAG
jgi:hypothetical protein